MSLSQRPAARFFTAFYRWNLQNQSSRHCAISSPRQSCGTRYMRHSHARNYHATSFLLQQSGNGPSGSKAEHIHFSMEHKDAIHQDDASRAANAQPELDTQEPPAMALEYGPETEAEALQSSVRVVMRNVPGSVAVVTVASIDPQTERRVPMGVAVSSLTTVSMNPPMISFNLKTPSKTLDAIRDAKGLFRVHIPSANSGGANIVQQFCQGNHAEAYSKRFKNLARLWIPSNPQDKRMTISQAPQIRDDDVQAAMECTVTQEVPVADHVILVARIDSIEKKMIHCPAVIYVHGQYKRIDGSTIKHVAPVTTVDTQTFEKLWDCAKFPGDKERRQYVEDIKALVKANKNYHEPNRSSDRKLLSFLPYHPGALGVNLMGLVAQCRQEMGLANPQLSATQRRMPVLNEFYGRLSPSARAAIIERAKAFVSRDIRFLSLEYSLFLQHLDVASYHIKHFLPSDIMKSLRAEGLVDPIGSQGGARNDIFRLERIEHNLVQHMRTLHFTIALTSSWEDLMKHSNGDESALPYFRGARARLLTMTHPEVYNSENLDISGHVNESEIRVVLRRIIHYLFPSNESQYRKAKVVSPDEILRRTHVHPTITGMDVEYFIAKIEYLYQTSQHFRDFAPKVHGLLDPWLDSNLSWTELQTRVKHFVQTTPLRATTWSKLDQMAAMAIHPNARVTAPGQAFPQPIHRGILLATLVAKELRNYYGTGSPHENAAIAKFLKDSYDYNVHPKPDEQQLADMEYTDALESEGTTSGGELREAMLANLNVDVRGRAGRKRGEV
ncbi:hypothetical protein J1614_001972 [Plenodomus biglobosus]|nr:hypothetical protein J1614_001972 [Plenodomus biglobosus]